MRALPEVYERYLKKIRKVKYEKLGLLELRVLASRVQRSINRLPTDLYQQIYNRLPEPLLPFLKETRPRGINLYT